MLLFFNHFYLLFIVGPGAEGDDSQKAHVIRKRNGINYLMFKELSLITSFIYVESKTFLWQIVSVHMYFNLLFQHGGVKSPLMILAG